VFLRWKIAPRAPGLASWIIARATRRRLEHRIRAFRPDVLLIHDGILLGRIGERLSRRLRVPYAVTEHDVMDLDPASRLGRHYAKYARPARAVFTVHEPSARHLREKLGIPGTRLVHNGTLMPTDAQRAAPRPDRWRDKRMVLHVGALIERKAHKETIRAFKDAEVPNSVLVLICPPREDFVALVEELGLKDRVEFIGFIPHDQVLQHMCWADLFVLPSWWEAFGLVYTEAMASETPVIMCRDCGLANFITPGVHGWVIPPKDHAALVRTLRHALTETDLTTMGRAGRALAEGHWTWDESARTLLRGLRGEPDLMRP
jgi:glycosyltransferase involved in cell wall biosynthesis